MTVAIGENAENAHPPFVRTTPARLSRSRPALMSTVAPFGTDTICVTDTRGRCRGCSVSMSRLNSARSVMVVLRMGPPVIASREVSMVAMNEPISVS